MEGVGRGIKIYIKKKKKAGQENKSDDSVGSSI